MIDIKCTASPFIFKPIVQLLKELDFNFANTELGMAMNLIDPLNPIYKKYKSASHLTDAQTKEEQIRYLGNIEAQRKLMYLAHTLKSYLHNKKICFRISPHFEVADLFTFFIKCLKLQCNCEVLFSFEQKEAKNALFYSCIENENIEQIYYSSDEVKMAQQLTILENAKICANAGDYWSALNLLAAIRDLPFKNKELENEVFCYMAICSGTSGDSKSCEFYWLKVLESGTPNQKNRAYYGLSMAYLRHHPKKFQHVDKGANYLNLAYEELKKVVEKNEKNEVDKVFNRNGYAFALFKGGKIDEAHTLVKDGIAVLDGIDTFYSKFHQSVLYYNVVQCNIRKKEFADAEATLLKLVSIDPKFFLYHEYAIEFYLKQGQLTKAMDMINTGLGFNAEYYKYHFFAGRIHYTNNDLANAKTCFEKALNLNPIDVGCLTYLTTIYNVLEEHEKVVELLKNFSFKFQNDEIGEVLLNNLVIALLHTTTNNYENILELIKDFSSLRPESLAVKELQSSLQMSYAE